MALSGKPTVRCLGVVSDSELKVQLGRLFTGGSFTFESFSEAYNLIEQLGACDVDFVILDPASVHCKDSHESSISWFVSEARKKHPGLRGRHFDPTLVDAFLSNSLGVEWIYNSHTDPQTLAEAW